MCLGRQDQSATNTPDYLHKQFYLLLILDSQVTARKTNIRIVKVVGIAF